MIEITPTKLGKLVDTHGGALDKGVDAKRVIRTIGPSDQIGADLSPVLRGQAVIATGILLVDKSIATTIPHGNRWIHAAPDRVLLEILGEDDLTPPAKAVIYPNVRLGRFVRIGPGSVIGAPGFRFVGNKRMAHHAGVIIEDNVEIGANCTVDAGILSPTTIKRGTKIDSQVHVGHGVVIGENCRIAAQVGLAGSVVIEDDVWIGGQAGIADHCRIGKGARIGAKAGVIGDIVAGAVVAGYPAVPRTRWLRGLARLYRKQ